MPDVPRRKRKPIQTNVHDNGTPRLNRTATVEQVDGDNNSSTSWKYIQVSILVASLREVEPPRTDVNNGTPRLNRPGVTIAKSSSHGNNVPTLSSLHSGFVEWVSRENADTSACNHSDW